MSILQELARVFRHAVPVKKFVEKAASLVQTVSEILPDLLFESRQTSR